MNRNQQESPAPDEPLREYRHGPVYLLVYLSILIILNFVLIGQEKKQVISC